MKTIAFIYIALMTFNSLGYGQDLNNARQLQLEVSSQFTRSAYGLKKGVNIGVAIKENWRLSFSKLSTGLEEERLHRNSYSGMEISYVIKTKKQIKVLLATAFGFHNKYYFSFRPGIQFRYDIGKKYFLTSGVSRQDRLPFLELRLGLKLPITK